MERKKRRVMHNKLIELSGNIRVFSRCRPMVQKEIDVGQATDVTAFPSEQDVVINRDCIRQSTLSFEFDYAFSPSSTQTEVFTQVKPIIQSFMDGYNVCIFAYGQTGSGKTYTMEGPLDDPGVNMRALTELFGIAQARQKETAYTFTVSYLEIYNENVIDLLGEGRKKDQKSLAVHLNDAKEISVAGLTEMHVDNVVDVAEIMAKGAQNRAVGSHNFNEHSSRSHSILTVRMRGTDQKGAVHSKLHLIDLAGSERVGKTGAANERLKEAQNINRSLSALGDVIGALSETKKKSNHVPYRNSKLTFILQDSLSGNSKVLMFSNFSPASYNVSETCCTLSFALRCRAVELGQAKKGSESAEMVKLKRELKTLRQGNITGSTGEGGGVARESTAKLRHSLPPSTSKSRSSMSPKKKVMENI